MIAVSWSNARKYIAWKFLDGKPIDKSSLYQIPTNTQWMAAYKYFSENKKKHDLNKRYSEWLFDAKDESMYEFSHDLSPEYTYDATPCDPPSMKRKLTVGNSFHSQHPNINDFKQHSYYQDSGYSHIGFRVAHRLISEDSAQKNKIYSRRNFDTRVLGIDGDQHSIKVFGGNGEVRFNLYKGMVHSTYESTHPNGQIRAKGNFYLNQRVGIWEFYDKSGELVLRRDYTNNLCFKQLVPSAEDAVGDLFLEYPEYPPYRESPKVPYVYHPVQERAVTYAKRLWVKDVDLPNYWRKLQLGILGGFIQPYDTTSDQFKDTMSMDEFFKRTSGDYTIESYKIKEDFFFDNQRRMGETRIIGICPMIKYHKDSAATELVWIYHPQAREILANECVNPWNYPSYIQNLDDILFFRFFGGTIYKEANVYDRELRDDQDPLQIKAEVIEQEHRMLIHFYSGK